MSKSNSTNNRRSKDIKLCSKKTFLFTTTLIAILGLLIRIHTGLYWYKHKEIFFVLDRPLFASCDAYLYARYADDLKNGKYFSKDYDELRFVPDGSKYPNPPFLISIIGAFLSKIFKASIEEIDFILTPILAVLFAFPLSLMFYRINLPITGLLSILLGVINLPYLQRSTSFRFDLDTLNLFFFVTTPLISHVYTDTKNNRRKKLLLFLFLINGLLFYTWSMHKKISLVIIAVCFAFMIRKHIHKNYRRLAILAFAIIILVVLVTTKQTWLHTLTIYCPGIFRHKDVTAATINELKLQPIKTTLDSISGNWIVSLIGLISFAILYLSRLESLMLLAPMIAVSYLSLYGIGRFSMYTAPFVGAGLGYICDSFKSTTNKVIMSLLFVTLIMILNARSFKYIAQPCLPKFLAMEMLKANERIEKNSWIWSWWDYGYAMQYIMKKPTFHDGSTQFTPKTYFIALSYVESNPKNSYKIINFISKHGLKKIEQWLAQGYKLSDIRRKILSHNETFYRHPIIWIMTIKDLFSLNNIHKVAMNNNKSYEFTLPIICPRKTKAQLICDKGTIDIKRGYWLTREKILPINSIIYIDDTKKKRNIVKYHNIGVYVTIRKARMFGNTAIIVSEKLFKSTFFQMYMIDNYNKEIFSKIYDNFPLMVIYKIKAGFRGHTKFPKPNRQRKP